jgi:dCTP deaminase
MGILSDRQIEAEVKIEPFCKDQVNRGVISHGLSSFGYDVRCGFRFKVFSNVHGAVVDPKAFDPKAFVDVDVTPKEHDWHEDGFCRYCSGTTFPGPDQVVSSMCRNRQQPDHVLVPPNSFALAETVEWIKVPRDCLALVIGKSTIARCGIILNCTPLEPEWEGKVTLEISNTTPLPAKVYAGEGIGQVLFFRSDEMLEHRTDAARYAGPDYGCRTSYADRRGRYQSQTGLTLPFVNKGE